MSHCHMLLTSVSGSRQGWCGTKDYTTLHRMNKDMVGIVPGWGNFNLLLLQTEVGRYLRNIINYQNFIKISSMCLNRKQSLTLSTALHFITYNGGEVMLDCTVYTCTPVHLYTCTTLHYLQWRRGRAGLWCSTRQ